MENKECLLSLCIPTNGATQWVIPTLKGIFAQECDPASYEVIIADNGDGHDLQEALCQFDQINLHYFKTKERGFLNIVSALKAGCGSYHRMLNHRSVLLPGTLAGWIDLVSRYKEQKPVFFFSDGKIEGEGECVFDSFDMFVRSLGVWSSWSAGIGIWHSDLVRLDKMQFDEMFPSTSLLFETCQESRLFVIDNNKYQTMQDETGKGGYDLFYTFGVGFLDILSALRHQRRISVDTFLKVKEDVLLFLGKLYYNEVIRSTAHTFIIQNVRQSIQVYFGEAGYRKLLWNAYMTPFKERLRKILCKK